ncbi:hypothetical protein BV22DRAFT_1013406, partial [Leucogyrophana mollusca]
DPPFHPRMRQEHGFNHIECGRLLCPVNMDWDDSKVRQGLRDGTITAHPANFPLFLYENETCNLEDLFRGWLKGDLLVRAYLHVFRSPSSAIDEGTSEKSTRRGNAALHSIRHVNIPSIAYVATIVRFVLSSQHSLTRGGSAGSWPHSAFYNNIIKMAFNTMDQVARKELLAWWDQ